MLLFLALFRHANFELLDRIPSQHPQGQMTATQKTSSISHFLNLHRTFMRDISQIYKLIISNRSDSIIGMGLLSNIKQLVQMNDFFYSSQMLRFKKQNQYRTLTGGLLSLGITVTIVIGFASMIIDTINLTSITTSLQMIKETDPTPTVLSTANRSNFMFGVEVWRQNLSATTRFFDVQAILFTEHVGQANTTNLPLEQCTKEHWKDFPDIISKFDKLGMSGWLCPPMNFSYQIFGKYSSQNYQQVGFYVGPCNDATEPSRPCASKSQIDQLFLDHGNGLYFTFYYINTVINSDQQDYKSHYLQDLNYVIFSNSFGSQAYLYFTDYAINTDYSIWPFSDELQDIGFLTESLAVNHPFPVADGSSYVNFYIAKSADSLVYTRSVQKISSVISFMGGMIGAVSALLFIINIYTSFSFEISIALQIFKPEEGDEEKEAKKDVSMNFLIFVKYYIYQLMRKVGKLWRSKGLQYLDECRSQILHQLDIQSLIKRIVFIEYAMTYLFEDYQLEGLQLRKPTTPHSIKSIREKCELIELADLDSQYEKTQRSVKSTAKNIDPQLNVVAVSPKMADNNSIDYQFQPTGQSLMTGFNFQESNMELSRLTKIKKKQVVVIEDINSELEESEESKDHEEALNRLMAQRRTMHIKSLKQSVDKGNQISKRIWQKLDIKSKKLVNPKMKCEPIQNLQE